MGRHLATGQSRGRFGRHVVNGREGRTSVGG